MTIKKKISLFLALIMFVSSTPVSTFAASVEETEIENVETEIAENETEVEKTKTEEEMAAEEIAVIADNSSETSIIASGECGKEGDNITWELDNEGTLTFKGTGEMAEYKYWNYVPWKDYCSDIKKVTIQEGITTVASNACYSCENLSSVEIPDTVIKIGDAAFSGCDSLERIDLPESLTSIGEMAFAYCDKLSGIKIPSGVTKIEDWTFVWCYALKNIEIPFGVTDIGEYAFHYCYNLVSVELPESLTHIGERAFYLCESLAEIELPSGLLVLENDAFGATALTDVVIPENVTQIGSAVFSDCPLENIEVDEDNKYYYAKDGILYNKDKTELIFCTSLKSGFFNMPESVKTVADRAFEGCADLKRIIVSENVTVLKNNVFDCCESLEYIRMMANAPSIETSDDESLSLGEWLPDDLIIYIPQNATGYDAAPWTDYVLKTYTRIDISTLEIPEIADQVYRGTACKPSIEISGLENGVDFTVTYSNNTEPGKATAIVTGIGAYKGTVKIYYNIKKLETPVLSSVSNTSTGVKVTWEKVTGADGYYIYRKADQETSYTKVKTVKKGTMVSWTDTNVSNTKKYSYKVAAYAGEVVSSNSSVKSVYYITSPTLSTPRNSGLQKMTVKWEKNAKAEGYQIQYGLKSSFEDCKTITIESGSTTEKIISNLTKGKKYYVRIRCYKTISEKKRYSAWSATKSVTIGKTALSPVVTYNKDNQDYSNWNWSSVVNSYLVDNGDGTVTRVEYEGSYIIIETYDEKGVLINSEKVKSELSLFGGFYSGTNYNFLVFGQTNMSESSKKEVIRVVRYTKNWDRKDAASLYGANTTVPFDAGSLRMVQCGDVLYIRTCHEMYTSEDGLNHQSNMTFSVQISKMKITSIYSGYVSHSFNQFIKMDGNELLTVDHGDAYPRAITLIKYDKPAGNKTFFGNEDDVEVFPIYGKCGDNFTGASIGGFEYSDSYYLIAGNSIKQDGIDDGFGVQNIFVTATSKTDFSEEGTKIHWITNYKDGTYVSTPHLVKVSDNRFVLMWTADGLFRYTFLNGDGTRNGKIYTINADLSDCQPIVVGNKAMWYVTDGENMLLYSMDLKSPEKVTVLNKKIASPKLSSVSNTSKGVTVKWAKVTGAAKYRVFRKSGSGSWAKIGDTTSTSYTDTTAKSGTTYTYTVRCLSSDGKAYTSSYDKTGKSIKYLARPKLSSAANTASGVTVKWGKVTGASGYYVYRKTGTGSFSKIATIKSGSTVSYKDTAVKSKNGTKYIYTVRAYSGKTLSSYESGKTIVRLTSPSISSLKNSAAKKMTVKWTQNSKVTGYQVQYSTSSKFSSVTTKTITGYKNVSKTITSLTKGKTYYVRVRSYKTVSGVKYYSGWSTAKSVKISK